MDDEFFEGDKNLNEYRNALWIT